MPIQGAHTRVGVVDVLGEPRVLQGVAADHAGPPPQEVVGAEADRAKIVVPRIPLDASHLLSLGLLRRKSPQRQQCALAVPELVAFVLPVLEVKINLVLHVLVDHALHDLDRQLHAVGVDRRVRVFLGLLLRLVVDGRLLLVLVVLLLLLGRLDVLLVCVEDVPLGNGALVLRRGRGLRRPTSLPEDAVLRLHGAVAEVELISQRVLHGHLLLVFRRVEELLLPLVGVPVPGLGVLLVLSLRLLLGLRTVLEEDRPVHGEVEDALIDVVVLLPRALLVRVCRHVVRRLRILRVEHARRHLLLELLGAQLQLVVRLHLHDDRDLELIHGVILLAGRRFGRRGLRSRGRCPWRCLRRHRAQ
mmetsp:Transcript_124611/g.360454  ORF Transcript_124611/g.360454 Transcript_124611/m.360454 type:complete len:359 (-) Transcript_124611:58-1134(-)